jgi:hypothetical protein
LEGVDLGKADLENATYNDKTHFSVGFDPAKAGMFKLC